MEKFFREILSSALRDTPGMVSSNWVAVFVSIFALATTFIIKVRRQQSYKNATTWRGRLTAMRDHWKQNLWDGVKVTVGIWVLLICISFARTLYFDHADLAGKVSTLTQERDTAKNDLTALRIVSENACKDDKQNLQQAKEEARIERDAARHWREDYEGITRGDLHPDRHLDSEDKRRLREELERISRDPRNKDYIKLDVGMSTQVEPAHLGWQLYYIFRAEHWAQSKPKFESDLPKELQAEMQAYGGGPNYAQGIIIFTDDQQKGRYLGMLLNACCRLDAIVNPRGIPQNFKGTLLWVGVKQYQHYRDEQD